MYQTCACAIHINLTHCQLHVAQYCQSYLHGVHVLREALVYFIGISRYLQHTQNYGSRLIFVAKSRGLV